MGGTAALACGVVGLLAAGGLVRAVVPVALGLTTTALGTLLPILRDNDMLMGPFAPYVLATGAVGEFLFPALAVVLDRRIARSRDRPGATPGRSRI